MATAPLLFAAPGRGAPPLHAAPVGPKACVDAYTSAQEKEQRRATSGAAKAALVRVRTRGLRKGDRAGVHEGRFGRLESTDIPSIIPHATDEKGAQRTDVKVGMDGELLTSHLDGQPLLVDPGLHELSFIAAGGVFAKEKVLIAEGQRGRVIDVTMKQGDVKELEKEVETETAAAEATSASSEAATKSAAAEGKSAAARAPFQCRPRTAPKGPAACMALYDNADRDAQSGHLREARGLLIGCARAACGHALLTACSTKFTQLDTVDVPSIRPAVTDLSGAARSDVQVRMDGELLAAHLDGQALPVDPGMHEFSFETQGGQSSTQKILIVQGEQGRALPVLVLGPGEVAPPPEKVASVAPSGAPGS